MLIFWAFVWAIKQVIMINDLLDKDNDEITSRTITHWKNKERTCKMKPKGAKSQHYLILPSVSLNNNIRQRSVDDQMLSFSRRTRRKIFRVSFIVNLFQQTQNQSFFLQKTICVTTVILLSTHIHYFINKYD